MNGIHDSVDACEDVLLLDCRLVYGLFDYYSALMDETRDAHGELEVCGQTAGNASPALGIWLRAHAIIVIGLHTPLTEYPHAACTRPPSSTRCRYFR